MLTAARTLHFQQFEPPKEEMAIVDEDSLLALAVVRRPGLSPEDPLRRTDRWQSLLELPRGTPQTRMVNALWDLVKWNEESIIEDSASCRQPSAPKAAGPYHMIDADNVWLGEKVSVGPGVVLDASKGPVALFKGASIGANSVIQGPCIIGPGVQVAPLTLIRAGTSIGPMCKVGGEIGNSVIMGYSNKGHYGYLGDSYVGKWVNLGAGTTTSNLKNTYGQISVRMGNQTLPSGRRFLGSLIGDHTKTAIETRLMSGTYIGFSSMIASSTITPKFVPSYAFLTDQGAARYDLSKAKEVMKAVFARRDRQWTSVDDELVAYVASAAPGVEE